MFNNLCGQRIIELEKLIVYNNQEINFIESYLNISALIDTSINKELYLDKVDEICRTVKNNLKTNDSPSDVIDKINDAIYIKEGLEFDINSNLYFSYNSEQKLTPEYIKLMKNSLIVPNAILCKKGICSSLSILYISIAQKLNLPIYAVVLPDHMFVRYDDKNIRINIETTVEGEKRDDDSYIKEFGIIAKSGKYLENLTVTEVLGLYLLGVTSLVEQKNNDILPHIYTYLEKLIPDFPELYDNWGQWYFDQKLYDEANLLYSKAIMANPYFYKSYFNRGQVFFLLNSLELAIIDYSSAIEVAPFFINALLQRGISYALMNNPLYSKSLDDFTKVISIDPKNSIAYYYRGLANAYLNKLHNSLSDFSHAIELRSDYAEAYYNRGGIKHQIGDIIGACEDMKKAYNLGDKNAIIFIKEFCD